MGQICDEHIHVITVLNSIRTLPNQPNHREIKAYDYNDKWTQIQTQVGFHPNTMINDRGIIIAYDYHDKWAQIQTQMGFHPSTQIKIPTLWILLLWLLSRSWWIPFWSQGKDWIGKLVDSCSKAIDCLPADICLRFFNPQFPLFHIYKISVPSLVPLLTCKKCFW